MMICGAKIVSTSTNYTFPIAFSTKICSIAFGQTGQSSSSIERISFKSLPSLTGMSLNGIHANSTSNGAYYIAFGF